MNKRNSQPTQFRQPAGSTVQPFHRLTILTLTLLAATLLAATLLAVAATQAQTPVPAPDSSFVIPHSPLPPAPDPSSIIQNPSSVAEVSAFQSVANGLLGHYGWLTTVLLAIGSLRILFKPVMLVVENSVKNDPVKLAEVQKFEAGTIYKTIAAVLDVGASIKLPLVKPPGPPTA